MTQLKFDGTKVLYCMIIPFGSFRADQEQPESKMLVRSQNEPADITDEAMPLVNEELKELKSGRGFEGGDPLPE